MAKKKAGKKKGSNRSPVARSAKSTSGKSTNSKKGATVREKHRGPRDVPLPGMEERRLSKLDDICTSIAETRDAINELKTEEAGNEQAALQLMRRYDRTSYMHGGVTLVRVPGEETLQVKKTRTPTATAQVEEQGEDITDEQLDQVDAQHDAEDAEEAEGAEV